MKKLLSILFALVISLTMVSGVSAALTSFDIQTSPSHIRAGESFQIDVEAWDEFNNTIITLNQTVSVDVGLTPYSLNIVHGIGSMNTTAPTGSFDITVDNGSVSSTVTRFGEDYSLIVDPTSIGLTATTNDTGYVTESMILTNNGNMNLTDVALVCTGSYSARCSFSPSSTYSISANGDYETLIFGFDVTGLSTGTYNDEILITATGIDDISVDVQVVITEPSEEQILYIDEVEINGEKIDLDEYEDGDDLIIEAKDIIGEDLEIIITIKNDGDEDVNDVEVNVEIQDIDDGDDIDDDDEIDEIKDGDEETITFTFTNIDWDADEETYTVLIDIYGEDDDDIEYEDDWDFDMEIEKEDDDIEITEAELDYSTVEVGDIAYLYIEIMNIGADDQNDAVIFIECEDLDLDFLAKNIELDEGDDYHITVPIPIDDDVDYKAYNIDITVYYDWDEYKDEDPTDADKVTLTVEGEEEEEEESTEESEVIIIPEETIPTGIPTTEEISFRETTAYTILLVLGSVLLIVMIVFLLVQLFKH